MKKNTLVIGDTHLPFEHVKYLKFLKRIEKAFKCERVIHIGDLIDNHAISYHEHDPDGWSPESEMQECDKRLKQWFKAFPKVYLCRGNHDNLVDRKGKTMGLPRRCFQDFRDVWGLPDGWIDDFEFVFDNVKYEHGTGYSGKNAHINAAITNRMSTVIGHVHSFAGVQFTASSKDCLFGMNVGCGIDRRKYAFDYGKAFKFKPIISCGVVQYTKHGINPIVIPMEMK